MPYQLVVDHPSIGEGQSLFIHGLGTFKNNATYEISDEQCQLFQAAHATVDVVQETQEDGTVLTRHEPKPGPHPVDVKIYGVRIVAPEKGSES